MKRALLLILPILLLSGCTIPGIGTLPFFGPATTAYENDVIIIKELSALPEKVAPGQPVKLVAYVQNVGNVLVDKITVELYDYCPGQFSPKDPRQFNPKYTTENFLPGQIKSFEWELTAAQLKLPTTCQMKVRANYSYTTQALSTISFIHYTEYQRLLSEGKFSPRQPYIAQGYGPIKPILSTLEQQPIPVLEGSTFTATFEIENRGGGFLEKNQIEADKISFSSLSKEDEEKEGSIANKLNECKKQWGTIELVQQRSARLACEGIPTPKVATETTITITTNISYNYEFRKDVIVTIQPA